MKKQTINNKRWITYFLLLLIAFLVGFPLFNLKMLDGHDGVFQLFRNYTTLSAIQDGQIIPMVNPNMMGGFGYAPNIFYGVLTTYIISVIQLFTPTLGLAVNLFTFLTIFLSGIFMYHFLKEVFQNNKIALLASIFYMIMPYHLYDIYVREALGEVMAFVFMPLLFHGLYNIIHQDQKKWPLLTFGTAGLLLSHNVSAFMAAMFACFYLLLNLKQVWQKEKIKKIIIALSIAILLSLITIVPLLEAKLSSDYMVFDSSYMHTNGASMEKNAINLWKSPWNGILNITTLFSAVLLIICFLFIKKETKHPSFQFLLLACLSLLLCISIIPWRYLPQIFSTPQFPWRYLQFTSFFLSIVAAYVIGTYFSKKKYMVCFLLLALISISPIVFLATQNKGIDNTIIMRNQIKKRDKIARSNGTASAEYLPRNAIYNYDYLSTRKHIPVALEGTIQVNHLVQKGSKLQFEIHVLEDSRIELPYIYYPGYIVKNDNHSIPTFETKNGMVGIHLTTGTYEIISHYRGTNSMIIAYLISSLTFIFFLIYLQKAKKRK